MKREKPLGKLKDLNINLVVFDIRPGLLRRKLRWWSIQDSRRIQVGVKGKKLDTVYFGEYLIIFKNLSWS